MDTAKSYLRHPSTVTFVTHGGTSSVFEATYFSKRMLFTSFYGDQISNAMHFERNAAGLWFVLEETDTMTMTVHSIAC